MQDNDLKIGWKCAEFARYNFIDQLKYIDIR